MLKLRTNKENESMRQTVKIKLS